MKTNLEELGSLRVKINLDARARLAPSEDHFGQLKSLSKPKVGRLIQTEVD